jgi:hypothetical protein
MASGLLSLQSPYIQNHGTTVSKRLLLFFLYNLYNRDYCHKIQQWKREQRHQTSQPAETTQQAFIQDRAMTEGFQTRRIKTIQSRGSIIKSDFPMRFLTGLMHVSMNLHKSSLRAATFRNNEPSRPRLYRRPEGNMQANSLRFHTQIRRTIALSDAQVRLIHLVKTPYTKRDWKGAFCAVVDKISTRILSTLAFEMFPAVPKSFNEVAKFLNTILVAVITGFRKGPRLSLPRSAQFSLPIAEN